MLPLLVTAAIIRKGDTVLLTRRPENTRHGGMWEFPGGKLGPEESPEEALCREIREELGIKIGVGPIFETAYYRYEWGPVLVLAYECRAGEEKIRHLGVTEHRWVRPEEIADFDVLPADRPIIEKLLRNPPLNPT